MHRQHHRSKQRIVIPPIVEFRYCHKFHSGQNISVPRAKCSICNRWFSLNHPLDHLKREHGMNFFSTTEVGSEFHAAVAAARKRLPLPRSSEQGFGNRAEQITTIQSNGNAYDSTEDCHYGWRDYNIEDLIIKSGKLFSINDIHQLATEFLSNHSGIPFTMETNNQVDSHQPYTNGEFELKQADAECLLNSNGSGRIGAKRYRNHYSDNRQQRLDFVAYNENYKSDLKQKKRKVSHGVNDEAISKNDIASFCITNGCFLTENICTQSPSATATTASPKLVEANVSGDTETSERQRVINSIVNNSTDIQYTESVQGTETLQPRETMQATETKQATETTQSIDSIQPAIKNIHKQHQLQPLSFNFTQSNIKEDLKCLSDCIDACVSHEKELQDNLNITKDILYRLRKSQAIIFNNFSSEVLQFMTTLN